MELATLIDGIDGVALASGSGDAVAVSAVTFDSRRVEPGALFVALAGQRADGHDYLAQAVEAGAVAVLVDADRLPVEVAVPVLAADDTRRVLGALAAAFYGQPADALQIVGVTGTNGKTTTSWILEALLSADGRACGIIGTTGYRWKDERRPAVNTTPESLVVQQLLADMRDDGVERVVMEVSSHGLATHRLGGTRFDVGVFTNLSQDHLDFHETMAAYEAAKARLFDELLPRAAAGGKQPVAVVNLDDAAGERLAEKVAAAEGVALVTYGIDSAAAGWRAGDIAQSLDGTRFTLAGPDGTRTIRTALLGAFNVANVVAAIAAARQLDVTWEAIEAGLANLVGVPGRMQRVAPEGGGPAVFVDYAHTPDALRRALDCLRPLTVGKLAVVFGCGGDRDRDKRARMGRVAEQGADAVWLTSDNPRGEPPEAILAAIRSGMAGEPAAVDVDRARAIAEAIGQAAADDVVLVAGKGHETYQEIGGERRAFDDVAHARRALAARRAQQAGRTAMGGQR